MYDYSMTLLVVLKYVLKNPISNEKEMSCLFSKDLTILYVLAFDIELCSRFIFLHAITAGFVPIYYAPCM